MKKHLLCIVISACCAMNALAAPELDAGVRAMIEQKVLAGEFPGLVIAVRDNGDSAVFGFGMPGAVVPDGHTVYEIGSVTKTFTGLLLAQAVAAGQVQLDDTLGKLDPDYARLTWNGRPITLLDLATQTSGLPRLPANLQPKDMSDPYAGYDRAALKAFLGGYALTRQPGSQYEYTNLGVGLLGDLLAEHANNSYADLIAERITGPLGMASTGAGDVSGMAAGHDAFGKPVSNWHLDALAGAGVIRSNGDDMLRYLQAMMEGRTVTGSPYALAQTPQRDTGLQDTKIGLAWHLSKLNGKTLIWHNGMTGGYASYIGYTDDGKRGVIVLTNTARSVDAIALAALFPELAAARARSRSAQPR